MRLAAGMTWRRWLIDIALIAGGVVSVIFEPFSIALHSVIGLAFVGIVGPHLWHRRIGSPASSGACAVGAGFFARSA